MYGSGGLTVVAKQDAKPDWDAIREQLKEWGCTLESAQIKKKPGDDWGDVEIAAKEVQYKLVLRKWS